MDMLSVALESRGESPCPAVARTPQLQDVFCLVVSGIEDAATLGRLACTAASLWRESEEAAQILLQPKDQTSSSARAIGAQRKLSLMPPTILLESTILSSPPTSRPPSPTIKLVS